MAPLIYLDTHVVAWMFSGRADLFPEKVHGHIHDNFPYAVWAESSKPRNDL